MIYSKRFTNKNLGLANFLSQLLNNSGRPVDDHSCHTRRSCQIEIERNRLLFALKCLISFLSFLLLLLIEWNNLISCSLKCFPIFLKTKTSVFKNLQRSFDFSNFFKPVFYYFSIKLEKLKTWRGFLIFLFFFNLYRFSKTFYYFQIFCKLCAVS